ncbi:SLAM family member 9-like [Dendropsophus ebraccatus]|uniref:SLAM family member 9-like n=1 Tax=Dendropsophus ebraccatus TaxID=150705 RepID=UPI0038318F85
MSCLLWILMGCFLKRILCEGSCGERRHVVGAVGSDVVFQVDVAGVVGEITWLISGNHFATSQSGKSIKIRDNQYKGKVSSMEDGSLLMKNVVGKDQGTYIASTLKKTSGKAELCAMIYELRVYDTLSNDHIDINYKVFDNETCNVAVSCTVRGSDMTITWESSEGGDLNVTGNVVHIQDPDPHVIYTCAARNSITYTSKSVSPWEYCNSKTMMYSSIRGRQQKAEDYTALNIIRLKLAACILIIMGFIFGHHMRTEVVASSGDNG